MSKGTFDVRVVFNDGEILQLHSVLNYGYFETSNSYYVEINGYRQFFNKEQVKYIGRVFDLDNK